MQRVNATGIGANPSDGIGTGLQACADIELKHDGRLRVFRENLHRPLALKRSELWLMVVVAGVQVGFFQLLVSKIQRIGDDFPAVESGAWLG